MIVDLNKKGAEAITLDNESMRAIQGGAGAATASFPCTVVEADGTSHTTMVSSVEECLQYAGYQTSKNEILYV